MITVTTYSRDHNYKIDLTVNGTTPAELTLVDITVKYPETEVAYPVIYPNFTFKFLGTKDIYGQFGRIGYDTHEFVLTSEKGHTFRGYLTPEVFSMPNTGFDEYFSINAVSAVENLKHIPFDSDEYGDTVEISRLIDDIFVKHAGIAQSPVITKAFTDSPGSVICANFINDDDEYENLFTVLEWIGEAFMFKFILNFDNTVSVYSLANLASAGGGDYATVRHYGIDETYNAGEIYDKATVVVSDYEQPQIPVDFNLKDPRTGNLPMKVRQGRTRVIPGLIHGKYGAWYIYERFISYFKPGESVWEFPKYRSSGDGIVRVNEFDESQIFNGGVPVMGAYPIAYRSYPEKGGDTSVPIEFALLIKNWDGSFYNKPPGAQPTVMRYSEKSFITEEQSYLLFTFDFGYTTFKGTPDNWENPKRGFEGEGLMDLCPVPIHPNNCDLKVSSEIMLRFSVEFRGKYWDDVSKGWVSGQTWFSMMPNTYAEEQSFGSIKDYPPPDGKPFYESVNGYWLGFKGNSGIGQLTVTIQALPLAVDGAISYWLRNFNIRFIQSATAEQIILPRQDTVYTNSSTSKFEYPRVTVRLSSKNESHASRSKLLDGDTVIDEFNYQLPTGSGTYGVREKPEYHIIRMITQYISRIKSVDDILDIDSFAWTRSYKGNRLWCNSLEYAIIDDTVKCRYYYNTLNYGAL